MSRAGKYIDTNLRIIFGITLIGVMGVASLTPAFPEMVKELNISSQAIGMLVTVFTLPGIILTPLLGFLADRWGRKKILIPSLIIFGIGGGACFFIRDFQLLLLFRFIQGIGAASPMTISVTLIGDLYSGKERTAVMGYNTGVLSVGTATYPLIGGSLATAAWHFPFLLPLAAFPMAFIALFFLKNPEPKPIGNIKTQFINGIKGMKNRQVIGIFIVSTAVFIILYGPCLTYLPLFMADSFKASPLIIGLVFTCISFVTAVTSSMMKVIIRVFPEKALLRNSFLVYGIAMVLIPFIPRIGLLVIPALFFGFAQGINLPSIQSILAGLAPLENRATFLSVNGMVLRVGQTIGPLLMGLIFGLGGMDAVYFISACICVLMFFLSSLTLK